MAAEGLEVTCKFFSQMLSVKDKSLSDILSTLSVLEEVLGSKKGSDLIKCLEFKGLITTLFGVIDTPQQCFMTNKEHLLLTPEKTIRSGNYCCSSHPLVDALVLKCLWKIAVCHPKQWNKCVDNSLLVQLVKVLRSNLDTPNDPSRNFFQFSQDFSSELKQLMKPKNSLTVKCKLVVKNKESQSLRKQLAFYNSNDLDFSIVQPYAISVKSLQVKVVDPLKNDINIADLLVSRKTAWRTPQEFPMTEDYSSIERSGQSHRSTAVNKSSEKAGNELTNLQWKEGRITKVLHGNFFWVLLGSDNIDTNTALSETLLRDIQSKKLKPIKAQVGRVIAAQVTSPHGKRAVRGHVLSSGCMLSVFCLDTGEVVQIPSHSAFQLPAQFSLTELPPLGSLASFAGLIPPPLDSRAVKYVLGILTSVCRYNVAVASTLMDQGVLSVLAPLLMSPNPDIVKESLSLTTNLLNRRRAIFCEKWSQIVFVIVERLGKYVNQRIQAKKVEKVQKSASRDQARGDTVVSQVEVPYTELLIPSLQALTNRLFMNKKAKTFFNQIQGLEVVVRILSLHPRHQGLRVAGERLLANFVHIVQARAYHDITSSTGSSTDRKKPPSTSSDIEQTEQRSPVPVLFDSEEEDGEDVSNDSGLGDSGDLGKFSPRGRPPVYYGDIIGPDKKTPKFYVYGSHVPFVADSHHELLHSTHMSEQELCKAICGMLNTGQEGKIYYGITESGEVVGESISHSDRDELRLAIDDIMRTKLTPSVLHSQFSLACTPVLSAELAKVMEGVEEEEEEECRIRNSASLFVVEITCKPVPKVMYCCRGDHCYYRAGATSIEISQQDVRQMIVIDEEITYRDHIERLKQELEELRRKDTALP